MKIAFYLQRNWYKAILFLLIDSKTAFVSSKSYSTWLISGEHNSIFKKKREILLQFEILIY